MPKTWDVAASLPPPETPRIEIDCTGRDDEELLADIIRQVYNIETDDRLLREAAVHSEIERARKFDALRKGYRMRREFANTTVAPRNDGASLRKKLAAMGFELADQPA